MKWKRTKFTRDIISRARMERQVQRERLWISEDQQEEYRVEIPWCYQHEFDRILEDEITRNHSF